MSRSSIILLFGVLSIAIVVKGQSLPESFDGGRAASGAGTGDLEETWQSAEEGTDEALSLWHKTKKAGKCVYGEKMVDCGEDSDYSSRDRKHSHRKRSSSLPKYDGKTIEEHPSNQGESYGVPSPEPRIGYVAPPPSKGDQYAEGAGEHTTEGHHSRGSRKHKSSPKREEPEGPDPAPRTYEEPSPDSEELYPGKKVKHHKSDRYKRSSYESQATPVDGKKPYEGAAPPKKKRHSSKKQHKEPEHDEMADYSTPTPAPTPAHQPEYRHKPPTTGQPPKPYPKEPESYDPSNYARYPVEDELDYDDYAVAVTDKREQRATRVNMQGLWNYKWPREEDSAEFSIQAEPYRMYTGINKPIRHVHRSHHQV